MWIQRLVMSPLLLLWILSACNSASHSSSRISSSNVDPWSDPHNVYKYLKTPSGQCLYQSAACSSLQQFSVTQFKTVSGFNGIPFGSGQIWKLDVNADGTLDDVDKYSGNMATFTAKHSPNAVKNGLFTYFTYSGEVALDGFESGNSRSAQPRQLVVVATEQYSRMLKEQHRLSASMFLATTMSQGASPNLY